MSIVRIGKRDHPFLMVDKRAVQDPRLSFGARGLLAFLLSKPDDWTINSRHLASCTPIETRRRVLAFLNELKGFGYLRREKHRSALTGRYRWEQVIYEVPAEGALFDAWAVDKSGTHGAGGDPWTDQGQRREAAGRAHGAVSHGATGAPITEYRSKEGADAKKTEEPSPYGSHDGSALICPGCKREVTSLFGFGEGARCTECYHSGVRGLREILHEARS